MKMPKKPPALNYKELFSNLEKFNFINSNGLHFIQNDKYRHWDTLRHITPPEGLTSIEWWSGIKIQRHLNLKNTPLMDVLNESFFKYNLTDYVLEQLHYIDLQGGGSIEVTDRVVNSHTKEQYLVHSLIEEAITSSQIEGAATTRQVAKEMIRMGRPPRDKSERMIMNNFHTMEKIKNWKDYPLTPELIFEIHRSITEQTLENPDAAGRFRKEDEIIVVEDVNGETLHTPPSAKELDNRIKIMCDFANGNTKGFVHPAIRSIILHFWLAYEHPFVDGNGRTARALFYWSMLRNGYWLFEYISISQVILKSISQYGQAFLHTETDDFDLTYFIIYHSEVIQKSIISLHKYINKKSKELRELELLLRNGSNLNYRQETILADAIRNPGQAYTIKAHKNSNRIAYDTARHDFQGLCEKGYFEMTKRGKGYIFMPVPNLEQAIRTKK